MIAAATLALTSYAIFAKLTAAPGYHILNQDPVNAYTTNHPIACPGITFPTTLNADTVTPNSDNEIVVDPSKVSLGETCSTTYTNVSNSKYFCVVGASVSNSFANLSLSAIPSRTNYYYTDCVASGPDVVLGAGS